MSIARKTVPVVIPFYKNNIELERCLSSLSQQIEVELDVFVRDNSEDNILYSKAINEGLRKYAFSGEHDYVMVLTQDAYLDNAALSELVGALEKDPLMGIAAPIQRAPDGKITWAGSLAAYPWGEHNHTPVSVTDPFNTYWANGACFLLRVSMIHEIGLLDENMLFICSDCDYSFTARSRGWGVAVVPTAFCEHYLKASSSAASPEIDVIKRADQLYFAAKWLNGEVYKSIALEGKQLTSLAIKGEFRKYSSQFLERKHFMDNFKNPAIKHKIVSILEKLVG